MIDNRIPFYILSLLLAIITSPSSKIKGAIGRELSFADQPIDIQDTQIR